MAVILLCVGLAGIHIFSKVAMDQQMSNYVLVTYSFAVATAFTAPFAIFSVQVSLSLSLSLSQPTFSPIYLSLERLNMLKSTENFWTEIGGLR